MKMRNALTFDIEEYFHAEAFSRAHRPEECMWRLRCRSAEYARTS